MKKWPNIQLTIMYLIEIYYDLISLIMKHSFIERIKKNNNKTYRFILFFIFHIFENFLLVVDNHAKIYRVMCLNFAFLY